MSHTLHHDAVIRQCVDAQASSRRQLGATTQRASQTNDAFVAGVKTLSQFERMQERAQMRLSAGFALFDVEVVCSHGTK
jgi:hypothetical protein